MNENDVKLCLTIKKTPFEGKIVKHGQNLIV